MKRIKVGDLMTDEVVSVITSTPFKDVAKLLAQHDVSGLPVLDDGDRVLGVVSESDLIGREVAEHPLTAVPPGAGGSTAEGPSNVVVTAGEVMTAGEIMSAPAVTVGVDETAAAAARLMARRGVERLPVVDDVSRLVGIVTRRDLLGVFLRPDAEIRRQVEDVLVDVVEAPTEAVSVHVLDGVVTLEGEVEGPGQVRVLIHLVSQLDGVVAVLPRLSSRVDDPGSTTSERSDRSTSR
ncbi:CBS domain-containing protein [Streptomyces sp. NPDC006879]|uniref:CBS domain-containing protein n=1 Tax=Streptomyces sp. NPDC006879 TaxID=3364767 RepID=UPI00369271CA